MPGRDIGLDQAGDHIDDGRCVARIKVNAGGSRLLRQAGDEFLDLLPTTIIRSSQFVDDRDDDVGRRSRGSGPPASG